jgi:hypothetical protein
MFNHARMITDVLFIFLYANNSEVIFYCGVLKDFYLLLLGMRDGVERIKSFVGGGGF